MGKKKFKETPSKDLKLSKSEKNLITERSLRFGKMKNRKQLLGINDKVSRMNDLFPPHLVSADDSDASAMLSDVFVDDALFIDNGRKSKPLAFIKITTTISLLVKENPKVITKAFNERSKKLNLLQENVYYENYSTTHKKRVLRKYVYHKSKYGIGYIRDYIKKTYKKEHYTDENGEQKAKWIYDVFDVVSENINPRNVVLDDNCVGVKDVNKPANDLYMFEFLTKDDYLLKYPEKIYERSKYVEEGQPYMVESGFTDENNDNTVESTDSKKIMVLIYENKGEGLRETWANKVPLESVPLPGGELSISGGKWIEDRDNYDGIGVGQIIEIYQPIVDDILNASLERLRQIVRPNEDRFNNAALADESDDIKFGSGSTRQWTGSKEDVLYTHPPARSAAEQAEEQDLDEEIDIATMSPKNLAGIDDAKTAFQSAQNREAALNKLSIPLDSIKDTLQDSANLSMSLFKLCYQEPLETTILTKADDDFDEALAIVENESKTGRIDERAVIMNVDDKGDPTIARRKFRQMELPADKEYDEEDSSPTGRIIEAEEKRFWELIPNTFNWDGRIEIVAESFLPTSKALEDERKKETIDFFMNLQDTDEEGNPTLKDSKGAPYRVERVRLAKERIRLARDFDPDKIIIPLEREEQVAGDTNPLKSKSNITLNQNVGRTRPELEPPMAG